MKEMTSNIYNSQGLRAEKKIEAIKRVLNGSKVIKSERNARAERKFWVFNKK